jgi:hypothetical protein
LLDTLAIGFSGMSMRPNQALIQSAQERIKGRGQAAQTAQQINKTLNYLRTLKTPEAMEAVRYAEATGDIAGALKMARNQPDRTALMQNYEYALSQGMTPEEARRWVSSGTVVNVGGKGETKFEEKTGEILATEASDVVNQAAQAQRSLGQIQVLETALQNAPSGAMGSLTNVAANLGIKTEGASDIELANSIISQLVPQQRPPGSGVMSDADLELFKQSLPRLINTREGNQMIIDTMKAIALYDMQRGQIARRLQLGGINPQQAFQEYNALGNPIPEGIRTRQATGSPSGSTPQGTPSSGEAKIDGYTIREVK